MDGSEYLKNALKFFKLLDVQIEKKYGKENVLQIITDNYPSYFLTN